MKLKECKNCYYEGREKCFYYDEEFERLEIKTCTEGFLDPYQNYYVGEMCKNCHYYQTNQCLGNELAKEQCLMKF